LAENKPTFLTEVELPPYCFLSEAVEWIAFGRVPQMQYHSDGSSDEVVDYRFYWQEMPENFEPHFHSSWFDRLEFESLGVPVTEEYFDAAEKCFLEFTHDLPKRIKDYESKKEIYIEQEDGTTINFYAKLASEARAKLLKLAPLQSLVDEVEARFKPH
jgi:hypothetical protein